MQRFVFPMALLFVLTMGSGCAIIGRNKDFRPIEEKNLAQVTPGKTTAADVMTLFGPPSQIVKLTNGNAYIYDRSLSKATGVWLVLVSFANYDTQHDRIVFFINHQDLVTHYGSSFKSDTASYGMPF
jgi:hypothetical protein